MGIFRRHRSDRYGTVSGFRWVLADAAVRRSRVSLLTQRLCLHVATGAIGKALAVALAQAGRSVTLVRASVDEVATAHELVTVQFLNAERVQVQIPVVSLRSLRTIGPLVVVATKAFGNDLVAEGLSKIGGKFSLVIMQNELGVERPFLDMGLSDVHRCVLFASSQVLADGVVTFKPIAPSPVGAVRATVTPQDEVVESLHTTTFPFCRVDDIGPIVWNKTIINCAYNSICPLLEIDNGIFARDARIFGLARQVVAEGVSLAAALGISLDEAGIVERLLEISRGSDGQLISTLQDLQNGRRTEIESLNLELARMADEIGQGELVGLTRSLGVLLLSKSESQLT